MRTTNDPMRARSPERPPRAPPYVHLRATSSRASEESCLVSRWSRHRRAHGAPSSGQLGETSTLPLIQTKPSPLKPRLQDAILFTQEGDHILVLALKPPTQHRNHELKRKQRLESTAIASIQRGTLRALPTWQTPPACSTSWSNCRTLPGRSRSKRPCSVLRPARPGRRSICQPPLRSPPARSA